MIKNVCLFQDDDIAPAGSGILAAEVVFDGVGKDIRFAFAILSGVLLRAEYNGFGAVKAVDAIDHGVETTHLLKLFGIDVEQVLL